jgi:hypothetical protein
MAHCDAAGVNGSKYAWRFAIANDAEWMSGKFLARLAPDLTDASSWMSPPTQARPELHAKGLRCAAVYAHPEWGPDGPRNQLATILLRCAQQREIP